MDLNTYFIVIFVLMVILWLSRQRFGKSKELHGEWTARVKSAKLNKKLYDKADPQQKYDLLYYFVQKLRLKDNYERGSFDKMPKALQIFDLANGLEREMNNGGYLQFFANSSGQYVPETLEALEIIGAKEHKALLEKAIKEMEKNEQSPEDLNERLNTLKPNQIIRSGDFFDNEQLNEMYQLDREFFNLGEDYMQLAIDNLEKEGDSFWKALKKR